MCFHVFVEISAAQKDCDESRKIYLINSSRELSSSSAVQKGRVWNKRSLSNETTLKLSFSATRVTATTITVPLITFIVIMCAFLCNKLLSLRLLEQPPNAVRGGAETSVDMKLFLLVRASNFLLPRRNY